MAARPGVRRATLDQARRPSLRAPGHPSRNRWQGNAGCERAGAPRAPARLSCSRTLTHKTDKTSFLLTTAGRTRRSQLRIPDKVQPSHIHGNVILRYSFGSWSEQKCPWEPGLSRAASEEEDAQGRLKGPGCPCVLGTMEFEGGRNLF